MEKFLSIPVTGEGNQLVPVTDIKYIEVGNKTHGSPTISVTFFYGSGRVTIINHDAVPALSMVQRNWFQSQVVAALSTPWTQVSYSAIPNPAYAVTGINSVDA